MAGLCRFSYPGTIYPHVIWCGQHMLASRRFLSKLGWMEPTCRHRQDAAKCRTELQALIADAKVENDWINYSNAVEPDHRKHGHLRTNPMLGGDRERKTKLGLEEQSTEQSLRNHPVLRPRNLLARRWKMNWIFHQQNIFEEMCIMNTDHSDGVHSSRQPRQLNGGSWLLQQRNSFNEQVNSLVCIIWCNIAAESSQGMLHKS